MATVYIVPKNPKTRPDTSTLHDLFRDLEYRVGQAVTTGSCTFYALKIEADGGLDTTDDGLERHAEVYVQIDEIANLVGSSIVFVPTADQIERVKQAFGTTAVELYLVDF